MCYTSHYMEHHSFSNMENLKSGLSDFQFEGVFVFNIQNCDSCLSNIHSVQRYISINSKQNLMYIIMKICKYTP